MSKSLRAATMNARELMTLLKSHGVKLWVEDGEVRFLSARGHPSASELAAIENLRMDLRQTLLKSQVPEDIPLEPRPDRAVRLRLTPTQSMPWNYSQSLGTKISTISISLRFQGPLDTGVLRSCLERLQLRHDVLRAKVELVDGVPFQRVDLRDPPATPIRSIGAKDEPELPDMFQRHIADYIDERTEYSPDCVFGAVILRRSNTDHVLVLAIDHVVTDGYSNRMLVDELMVLYLAQTQGRVLELPRPALQFHDYVAWLWRMHATWKERHASYWIRKFSDAENSIWSGRKSRMAADPAKRCSVSVDVADVLLERVLQSSKLYQCVPAIVLVAAYAAAVLQWSHRRALTVMFVDSGRYRRELGSMVGCLAGHLYLRVEMRGNPTVREFVTSVAREYSAACAHRDFEWAPGIIPNFSPDIYFNFFSLRPPSAATVRPDVNPLGQLEVNLLPLVSSQRQLRHAAVLPCTLGFNVSVTQTGHALSLSYDDAVIEPGSMAILTQRLSLLLHAVVDAPDANVEMISRRV